MYFDYNLCDNYMLLVEHVVDNAAVNCQRVSSELVKIWWFIFVILFLFNIIYKPKRRLHYMAPNVGCCGVYEGGINDI